VSNRETEILDFLQSAGWAGASRRKLAGDASRRRYERIADANLGVAILMDAPPGSGETILPFVTITGILRDCGLSAPRLYHSDLGHGFLLLEDLGDRLFATEARSGVDHEREIYHAAVDTLLELHKMNPSGDVGTYEPSVMAELACLAITWYSGETSNDAVLPLNDILRDLLEDIPGIDEVLVLRDFHAENLIWLPERTGVQRVGLLDYQDALRGHAAYDLASLLEDARRDVPGALREDLLMYYLDQSGKDGEAFRCAYSVLAAQRNLRIIGVFARLGMLYGKPKYIDLIPRVWRNLSSDLGHPRLKALREVVAAKLPAPSQRYLDELKSRCPA